MEAIDTSNPIHRISLDQFHRMIDAGVFAEGDRVELIDGEMRDMTPIGPPHSSCTDNLNMTFASKLAGKAIVRAQGALVVDEGTELYPDLVVLRRQADWYRKSHPTGEDALLAIEVADTSLSFDLKTKLPKYAHAGIRRYWIIDVKKRTIHDYRDPDRIGRRYRQLYSATEGEVSVTIEGVVVRVRLDELFPG
jgi:Uma2 family endonuclease